MEWHPSSWHATLANQSQLYREKNTCSPCRRYSLHWSGHVPYRTSWPICRVEIPIGRTNRAPNTPISKIISHSRGEPHNCPERWPFPSIPRLIHPKITSKMDSKDSKNWRYSWWLAAQLLTGSNSPIWFFVIAGDSTFLIGHKTWINHYQPSPVFSPMTSHKLTTH